MKILEREKFRLWILNEKGVQYMNDYLGTEFEDIAIKYSLFCIKKEMTRKSGYYWVKLPSHYGWHIGCYTQIDELWSFFVTRKQYTDSLLIEINEETISKS